jgi:hypothetical protein
MSFAGSPALPLSPNMQKRLTAAGHQHVRNQGHISSVGRMTSALSLNKPLLHQHFCFTLNASSIKCNGHLQSKNASPVALADELCWLSCVAGLQLTSAHHDGADAELLERKRALEGLTLRAAMSYIGAL